MAEQTSASYEAPQAEVVRVEGSARCIGTSVPIDGGKTNIPPDDIG